MGSGIDTHRGEGEVVGEGEGEGEEGMGFATLSLPRRLGLEEGARWWSWQVAALLLVV